MLLAIKNLRRDKIKLAISAGGVSFALLLILILNGIFAGIDRQATAFIRNSNADVWVMQKGVSNMHMANTMLPATTEARISAVPGTDKVSSILYVSGYLKIKGEKTLSYVVGFDPKETRGGPWAMAAGRGDPVGNEAVIDENLAAKRNVGIGEDISVLGRKMRIIGLSRETYSLANTVTFVNRGAMAEMMRSRDTRSYFLVAAKPGQNPRVLSDRIKQEVGKVNALPTKTFAAAEAEMIRQMGTDIINAMSVIGFIIGVLVVGLTIFTATLERSRDYAVLKAVGASIPALYAVILWQALFSVGLGFSGGLLLAYLSRILIQWLAPDMPLIFTVRDIVQAAAAMVVIAAAASYIPGRKIAKLDPMVVFKS